MHTNLAPSKKECCMSYTVHFGLDREPFSNAPDARFYYDSEQHRQALQRLLYGIDSNKGLAVLVGAIGTGKTTLARRMLDCLPDDR
jgi:general secretion pathway protein A